VPAWFGEVQSAFSLALKDQRTGIKGRQFKSGITEVTMKTGYQWVALLGAGVFVFAPSVGFGQSIDRTQAPNTAQAGIAKSLTDEIGTGRGDIYTPGSSLYIIGRDPFRSVRRGRQLFQRKFTRTQGQGAGIGDGVGDINTNIGIGAGLVDSCGGCHARPRGSAGFGGDVVTRPDSRSAPHLFGLGLKEMLADEITADLRAIRARAISQAVKKGRPFTQGLTSKGINFGTITANPDGSVNTSNVQGVDSDLRVRPFFAQGGTISIREFIVGALHAEMGLESDDPDLAVASAGGKVTTPAGMVLDGSQDRIEAPPPADATTGSYEIPTPVVDHMEFYLLNYFKPGTYQQTPTTQHGLQVFNNIGCGSCHIQNLQINLDRRVADVQTVYDPVNGIFNTLFATATPLVHLVNDGSGFPALQLPNLQSFLVQNIFTDFKRHDLGANFYERNYDGTLQKQFLTRPLWGVGTSAPYGHDGRSVTIPEVILRHGGEAQEARDTFAGLSDDDRNALLTFLSTLVLFPPDDTASNLDPGNRSATNFPQFGHGSIKLTVLFNDPSDPE
jgi:hypothetical protein